MIGGYCKGNLIRLKLNELNSLAVYDRMKVHDNIEQLKCMVDLEIITREQAEVTIDMYRRLEKADKWDQEQDLKRL